MTTWEPPSISVIVAPARWAIDLTMSPPIALSFVPTAAHDGRSFHPGCAFFSANAASATGRWEHAQHVGLRLRQIGGEHLVELGGVDDHLAGRL